MLLLVLILVVLAFGLLVFALQAGSVIAAWVSVGLSVAAALVLLVDWLQRRSAMRAGAASLEAAGERPTPREREFDRDPEPATEVLPVIPPSGPVPIQGQGPEAEEATMVAARPAGPASAEVTELTRADAGPAGAHDDADDGAKTVLMPAVQPSGSSAGPSGATPGFTASSGSSSPSVTKSGADAAGDVPSGEGAPPGTDAPAAAPGSDATVAVDTRKRPASGAAASTVESKIGGPDAEVGAPAQAAKAAAGADDGPTTDQESSQPSGQESDAASGATTEVGGSAAGAAAAAAGAAGVAAAGSRSEDQDDDARTVARSGPTSTADPASAGAPPSGPRTAQQPAWSQGRRGDSNLSGSDLFGSGETRAQEAPPAGAPSGPGVAAAAGAAQPPAGGPGQPPSGQRPNGVPGQSWQPPSGAQPPVQEAPVENAAPPGEPPEEQRDPAAAAVVAGLEVEVIVIDEQPRYHVVGCAALTGNEPIPIPAREAVELGFSPCGWCTPDRTLAERYPATAR